MIDFHGRIVKDCDGLRRIVTDYDGDQSGWDLLKEIRGYFLRLWGISGDLGRLQEIRGEYRKCCRRLQEITGNYQKLQEITKN